MEFGGVGVVGEAADSGVGGLADAVPQAWSQTRAG